jgi:hypothetical protein
MMLLARQVCLMMEFGNVPSAALRTHMLIARSHAHVSPRL